MKRCLCLLLASCLAVAPCWAIERNVGSQVVKVYAWDTSANTAKTGDAANITVYVSKDGGAVTALTDTSATEDDATNAKGVYEFDLTQGETDAKSLSFSGKSSTADVVILPFTTSTVAPNFGLQSINSSGKTSPADGSITSATFGTGAITATVMAADAIGSSELAATAAQKVADANRDFVAAITATNGSTTTVEFSGGAAVDDFYNGMRLTIFDASVSNRPHEAIVTDYDQASGVLTFAPAAPAAVVIGDTAILQRASRHVWDAYTAATTRLPAALTAGGNMKSDALAVNGVATSGVTTVNANLGTTQPINHTGTGGSALVSTSVADFTSEGLKDMGIKSGTFSSGASGTTISIPGMIADEEFVGGCFVALMDGHSGEFVYRTIISVGIGDITLDESVDLANQDRYVIIPRGRNLPGKVIGSGGVAMTAAGVRAVDGSGNTVAPASATTDIYNIVNNGTYGNSALKTAIDGVSGAYVSDSGTAQAGAAGSITLRSGASAIDDLLQYQLVTTTGGTGAGQARFITAYDGTTKVATVGRNWEVTPDNTTSYTVTGFDQVPGASAPTANEVADAVWDETTAGHVTAGTFGEQLKTDVDAILDDTGTSGVQIPAGEIVAGSFGAGALDGVWSTATRTLSGAVGDFDELLSGAEDGQTLVQNAMTAQGYTPTVAGYLTAPVATASGQTSQTTVLNKLDAAFASSGVFSSGALANAPSGGAGTADWTTDERSQIRNRLGIDGTAASPSATPTLSTAAAVASVATSAATAASEATSANTKAGDIQSRLPATLNGGLIRSDATLVADEQLIEDLSASLIAGGVGGAPISAGKWNPANRWRFDSPLRLVANNTVTQNRQFNGLAVMDFTNVLPQGTRIYSIGTPSITPTSGIEPQLGTAKVDPTNMMVLLPVNIKTAGGVGVPADVGTFTVTIPVVTTDADNPDLAKSGYLVVQ